MLNHAIGTEESINGQRFIRTRPGIAGHAVYGPYTDLYPGRYVVEFDVTAPAAGGSGDVVCGHIDVSTDFGVSVKAESSFTLAQLADRRSRLRLSFDVETINIFEFRVYTTGTAALLVADTCRWVKVEDSSDAAVDAGLLALRYPDPDEYPSAQFFKDNLSTFGALYDKGIAVRIQHADVVLTFGGVSFFAKSHDDMRFIGEIFFNAAYNVLLTQDACAIDVGMNSGLVTLSLASKHNIKRVHSFEPFASTYARAKANIDLNPSLAAKVETHNFGLSGSDRMLTVQIGDPGDSGQFTAVRNAATGTPVTIEVRSAATVLAPIIADAKRQGLAVIAKIDCEGSEYEVFDSLKAAGLLEQVTVLMVEWHHMVAGRTERDLIDPLLQRGFVVFDLRIGQGFFYAVKAAP